MVKLYFSSKQHFYSYFQNPSENSANCLQRLSADAESPLARKELNVNLDEITVISYQYSVQY